ncbi:hypothetical protein KQ693_05950 [Thermus sp. PS18]|uniref:hypothetical protein n=1 Tax=Thermus sp. PS18 TaxID=2849039 RepID=UPI0022652453|nr:hypothetical protein [Thermus sp. PS18]UZX16572.1 hypothetical protein KQ693_05950 [Thermus sp. PS18]
MDKVAEYVLLAFTTLAGLGFLVRSLLTGEDIPQGWALLLGSVWGALLGVRELLKRKGGEE